MEPLKRWVCDSNKPTKLLVPLARERETVFLSLRCCERELFDSDAIGMLARRHLWRALRDIDRLATSALREPARRKKQLERDTLARILDAETDATAVE